MNIKPITIQATPIRNQNGQVTRNFQNPSFGMNLPNQTRREFLKVFSAFFAGGVVGVGIVKKINPGEVVKPNGSKISEEISSAATKILKRIGIRPHEEFIRVIDKILPEWKLVSQNSKVLTLKYNPKDPFATFKLEKLKQVLALNDYAVSNSNPNLKKELIERSKLTGVSHFRNGDSVTLRRDDIAASSERLFKACVQHLDVFSSSTLPSKGTAQYYKNILDSVSPEKQFEAGVNAFQRLGWQIKKEGDIVKIVKSTNSVNIPRDTFFNIFGYTWEESANNYYTFKKPFVIYGYAENKPNINTISPMQILAELYEKINLMEKFPKI